MANPSAPSGGVDVTWLTKFLRSYFEQYPISFIPSVEIENLSVKRAAVFNDQVSFTKSEDWMFIGTAAQPAFQNAWVNYGAPYANASYLRGPDGFVHLHGMIKTGTVGSAAFTLPPGYRPAADLSVPCMSNGALGRLDITSGGVVTPISPSNNASVSLDGILFKAA